MTLGRCVGRSHKSANGRCQNLPSFHVEYVDSPPERACGRHIGWLLVRSMSPGQVVEVTRLRGPK
jgi:hypothetical protein